MPPIHCMSARQNSRPRGKASTSAITVEPVVVKPAMVSKKASVTLVNVPLVMNGNMPKAEKNTQMMAVSRSPSRLRIDVLWFLGFIT